MFSFLKKLLPEPAPAKLPVKPAAKPMTPQRAALLKNAMAVHRAKQKILDDLSDEDRAKLLAMAITTMLHNREEGK